MTHISPSNQTLLRKQPHDVELSLSIWQPTIVFQCRVNNSAIAKNARAIAYDTVSLGSYTVVEAGMTLWVGTQPGLDDVGKVRIRSITSSTITVAENSDILWADNQYLTVINQREMWPVYPRMIQDESNPTTVLWYKDYDVAYTNENSILGSFICMGGNRAGDLRNGSHQEYFSASGTVNVAGSAISSYYWEFGGASPASGTTHTPGMVTWDTPGDYIVSLKTTAANGGTDTSYRYVKIEDTPTVTSWEFGRPPTGSRADGESTCEIIVYELPDDVTIRPQTIVTIYSKERRGDTTSNFNGNVFFTGYVRDGSIEYNYDLHSVSFELVSIVGLMKESENFGVSLEYVATPTDWYEIAFATLKPAIYHYLKYHSTVLSLADFEFVGTDRNIQYFDIARETLYGGLSNLLKNTLFMEVVSDRHGKIWSEVMAKAIDDAPTTFPSFMEIQKHDWVGEPNIKINHTKPLSYIELNGIKFSTTGSVSTPLIGCAPGTAPGTEGKAKRQPGLALSSQEHLNTLCGNIYTNENYKLPQLSMSMRGAWTHLDIAPQEAYKMNILAEDTVTGVDVSGSYFADTISWEYDHKDSYLFPNVTWKAITQNDLVGDTIEVPPAPTTPPISNPSPTPPELPLPLPEPEINFSIRICYVLTNYDRVLACGNILDGKDQVWVDITPSDDVSYSIPQAFTGVDWLGGSLYMLSDDHKTIYRCYATPVGESFIFTNMSKWLVHTDFPYGGANPDNNTLSLGINQMTGEMCVVSSNTGMGNTQGIWVGTVDGLTYIGEHVMTLNTKSIITIGNGVILISHMRSTTNSQFEKSTDGGANWEVRDNTTLWYGDFRSLSWHFRPNPLGNHVIHGSVIDFSAAGYSENLCETSDEIGANGINAIASELNAQKIVTVFNEKRKISLDAGQTWDEEVTADPSTGRKLQYVWAGYDDNGNDLWLLLTYSGNQISYPGSNDTIYASTDDCQTYLDIAPNLKQALIDGGQGVDIFGNSVEKPTRMWVVI